MLATRHHRIHARHEDNDELLQKLVGPHRKNQRILLQAAQQVHAHVDGAARNENPIQQRNAQPPHPTTLDGPGQPHALHFQRQNHHLVLDHSPQKL